MGGDSLGWTFAHGSTSLHHVQTNTGGEWCWTNTQNQILPRCYVCYTQEYAPCIGGRHRALHTCKRSDDAQSKNGLRLPHQHILSRRQVCHECAHCAPDLRALGELPNVFPVPQNGTERLVAAGTYFDSTERQLNAR